VQLGTCSYCIAACPRWCWTQLTDRWQCLGVLLLPLLLLLLLLWV
jgi:hypothetical protein